MPIHRRKIWEIPGLEATSEQVYYSKRAFMKGMVGGVVMGSMLAPFSSSQARELKELKAPRNENYTEIDRELTSQKAATSYNNFYEFGSHKTIASLAQELKTEPWKITIDGLVDKPLELDIDDLRRQNPFEERLYRLRCVETWAMAVPWIGFPFKRLLDMAKPLSHAKFIQMETDQQPENMPGLSQSWYPWPYTEGLSIEEAAHDLAFLVFGLYGKEIPPQNGAPIRLAVPWKYGFKSVKSIKRFTFTDKMPTTFWNQTAKQEYGFWANVNPDVPHRRWSQKYETMIETSEKFETQIFNGYGEAVASLYAGKLEDRSIFY